MSSATILMLIAGGWGGYFLLHSLLASQAIKGRFSRQRCYRLSYNVIALVTLLPLIWLHTLYSGQMVIQWQPPWTWLAGLMSLAALACFLWTLRYYDLGEFSGWRTCRDGRKDAAEGRLVISPPHRYVRHPWYSCALVLIWCHDMDLAQLLTATLLSAYLVIGSRLEERRLIGEYGNQYREYIRSVPGLIPLPWKRLSREKADRLMSRMPPD